MRDELEEYVERAQGIIDEAPQMGETNTKEMLVRRFIRALGWEFHPSEVKLEYPVRMASRRTKVDYALMLKDTPVVFVEAKGLDTELSDGHREQVTSYMHNEEGVDWGLLTNGEEYEFFRYDGTPSGFSLGALQLDELSDNIEVVEMLSKGLVDSEKSKERADRLRERRRAVSNLRDDKDEIADDITGVVTDHVGESIASVAETEAKEFVDSMVEELENERGAGEGDESEGEEIIPNPDEKGDIVLTKGGTVVTSFDGESQAEAMAKTVEHLIDKERLLERISLPYVPKSKKAVLNDKPKYPNGDKMKSHKEMSGIYLDVNMSKEQKEEELRRLAGKCDLSAEFDW